MLAQAITSERTRGGRRDASQGDPDSEAAASETQKIAFERNARAMKSSLYHAPKNEMEMPEYLTDVTAMFEDYKIPDKERVRHIRPFLSEQARSCVIKFSEETKNNWSQFCIELMETFKLMPMRYKSIFHNMQPKEKETAVMFGNRCDTMLRMYVKSREVKDMEEMIQMAVSDKIRNTYRESFVQNHITQSEITNWLRPKQMCRAIDGLYAQRDYTVKSETTYQQGRGRGSSNWQSNRSTNPQRFQQQPV